MVKTNSLSPSFSTFSTKRKKFKHRPFYDENPVKINLPVQVKQIPHHVRYVLPIQNKTLNNTTTSNSSILINPFNNPPLNCSESDIRWIWRKQLEQKRRHIRNTKYYNHYVGNNNHNNNGTDIPIGYSNHHHLKHLVKIGCPSHDLSPILSKCGYNVSPPICTHKSYLCCNKNLNNNNRILLGEISMKNVGLTFKRNAFSILPLHIRYNNFETDVYIKRIANTNFNKSFRPGSYGKLHSLKKGSWKEGKIFYVFKNDELVMNICNGLYIVFDMNANKSNNIIDGFKNIVGGVGFYRPPQSTKIVSCLVFRKDPNFPMECLENSMIKIYSLNGYKTNTSKLIIGDKTFDFSNGLYEDEIHCEMNGNSNSSNDNLPNMSPFYGSLNSNNSNNSLNSNISNDTCSYNSNIDMNIYSSDTTPNYNNNEFINSLNNNGDMKRNEFEEKYLSLQYQHNLLIAKNCKLQTLNKQLMESNSNLRMEKERQHKAHTEQIQQLQHYLEQQHKQINKLNQQINRPINNNNNNNNNNHILQSAMDSCSIDTPQMDQYSVMYPLINNNNNCNNYNNLEEEDYLQNFSNNYPLQDFQSI